VTSFVHKNEPYGRFLSVAHFNFNYIKRVNPSTVYCLISALFEENETLGNAMKSVCLWQEILLSLLMFVSS